MTQRLAYLLVVLAPLFDACTEASQSEIETLQTRDSLVFVEQEQHELKFDSSAQEAISLRGKITKTFLSTIGSSESEDIYRFRKLNTGPPIVFDSLKYAFKAFTKEPQKIILGAPKKIESAPFNSRDVNPSGFALLGIRQGLPDQMLRCAIQDSLGFIWLAHQRNGITRFDGTHVFNYSTEQGLPSNDIIALCTDRAGNLWIGSNDNGLFCYDGYRLAHYTTENGLCANSINTLYADTKGRIWVGSNEAGISIIDGNKIANFTEREGIPGAIIWRFWEQKNGTMAIAGIKGLSFVSTTHVERYSVQQGLPDSIIWAFNEDSQNRLFIGTANEGLLMWNGEDFFQVDSKRLNKYSVSDLEWRSDSSLWISQYGEGVVRIKNGKATKFDISSGLPGLMAVDLLQDRDGCLWTVLYGSELSRLGRRPFNNISQDLFPQKIKTLLSINASKLWLGSSGEGIFELDGENLYSIRPDQSPEVLRISCFEKDSENNIWFGTVDNGIAFIDKNLNYINWFAGKSSSSTLGSYVTDILCDTTGKIWIGTDKGLNFWNGNTFVSIDAKENGKSPAVRKLHQDKSGQIWVLFDNTIGIIHKNKINYYTLQQNKAQLKILSFMEGRDGDIWLGTEHNGIARIRNKSILQYTKSDGLLDDAIYFICEDLHGNLLIGHPMGMSRIRKPKYFFEPADIEPIVFEDGFTGIGLQRDGAYKTEDGQIWVISNNQLSVVDANSSVLNRSKHTTYINEVRLFGEPTDWQKLKKQQSRNAAGIIIGQVNYSELNKINHLPQNLVLPYNANYLSFSFAGISPYQSSQIKYAWMLEGADEYWTTQLSLKNVSYANLSPGTYTFWVKSSRDGKTWSTADAFPFEIKPPWWKTTWMYSIYSLGFLATVWAFTSWRNSRLLKRAIKLENEVEKATATIRKQKEQVLLEKEKSEELLLNILPVSIANELKETGFTKARHFKTTTVLFTDFVGFTALSEQLSTSELVELINAYFSKFDAIMKENGIEKIKTIGDAYMAVGGMPVQDEKHAIKTIGAAMEITKWIEAYKLNALLNHQPFFDIRIGVHSGPVIAGVVGTHKFQYDVWGDTVNTASRLESTSEIGKINISEQTYHLIKDYFLCTYRGKIGAKGKGAINMYFVESML